MLRLTHVWLFFFIDSISSYEYKYVNLTVDPASRQLLDFKEDHPKPIGILTTSAGAPVEIRDTVALNSDLFSNEFFFDNTALADAERIPERVVHAKGAGALGYFVVTNDVSKYTIADVFNGIGKKTPLVSRFSLVVQSKGGSDLARETRGLAIKFYTKEGNLDLVCLNFPVYVYKDPNVFPAFLHSFKMNPKTNLVDSTMRWDFLTSKPNSLHGWLWILSDFGIPNGWRKMDAFPIHTYEIHNKEGERYYVRFNFISEQGLEFFTTRRAQEISVEDPDYANRDLYNAIETGNFPSWRLEMDVISKDDLKKLDYDPFDVIRLWKNGTYHTVTIGRVVLNKNPDNVFKVVEQGAFNPANLVPGIPGPVDIMFKSRRYAYRDTQNHRLGYNHNKIEVNHPKYAKGYTRDGKPPVRENMKDAPNYYPNSFNGPAPYVEQCKPSEKLMILQSNAADLEPASYFYNYIVRDEGHKRRLVSNLVASLSTVASRTVLKRVIDLMYLIDPDLGERVVTELAKARPAPKPHSERYEEKYERKERYQKKRLIT